MSSYFDAAQALFQKLVAEGRELAAEDVVVMAYDRYKCYLEYVRARSLKSYIETIDMLQGVFQGMMHQKIAQLHDPKKDFVSVGTWAISDLHSFAHEVGRSTIRLRGGLLALDNPYWSDMEDDVIMKEIWR